MSLSFLIIGGSVIALLLAVVVFLVFKGRDWVWQTNRRQAGQGWTVTLSVLRHRRGVHLRPRTPWMSQVPHGHRVVLWTVLVAADHSRHTWLALPSTLNPWLARLLHPHILASLAMAVNYSVAWEVIFSEKVIVSGATCFRGGTLCSKLVVLESRIHWQFIDK